MAPGNPNAPRPTYNRSGMDMLARQQLSEERAVRDQLETLFGNLTVDDVYERHGHDEPKLVYQSDASYLATRMYSTSPKHDEAERLRAEYPHVARYLAARGEEVTSISEHTAFAMEYPYLVPLANAILSSTTLITPRAVPPNGQSVERRVDTELLKSTLAIKSQIGSGPASVARRRGRGVEQVRPEDVVGITLRDLRNINAWVARRREAEAQATQNQARNHDRRPNIGQRMASGLGHLALNAAGAVNPVRHLKNFWRPY